MKSIYLIILFILLFCNSYAQSYLEESGLPPEKVLTYSSQYNELDQYTRFEQIGSVIIDIESRQIVSLIKKDTIFSEATLQPTIVTRWLSPDPLEGKFPEMSPYVFVKNNPIIYVDQDGQENVIYLVVLPNAQAANGGTYTEQDIKDLIDKTNSDLKGLHLKTKVVLYTGADPINQKYLDPTDAIALLGSPKEIKEYINTNLDVGKEYSEAMKAWNGGESNQEKSENNNNHGGGVVAVDGIDVSAPFKSYASFLILHGAGHNASEGHTEDAYGGTTAPMMYSGEKIRSLINDPNSLFYRKEIDAFKKAEPNIDYTRAMRSRFGTHRSEDNYEKNKSEAEQGGGGG